MQFDILHIILLLAAAGGIAAAFIFRNKKSESISTEDAKKISEYEQLKLGLNEARTALSFVEKQSAERLEAYNSLQEKFEQERRNTLEVNKSYAAQQTELANARAEIVKLAENNEGLNKKISQLTEENRRIAVIQNGLEEQKKALDERIKEQQQFIADAQKSLAQQFENISNKQLENQSEKFIKNSSENLGNLLNPLKENIENFKKEFTEKHIKDATALGVLEASINKVIESNSKTNQTAENLAKALKGDRKMQGNWGEMLLEKLLEDSGLKKDVHYTAQASFTNEEGQRQLPDFLIKLPEGKHIIVDSKVSLISYESYFNEEDETVKLGHVQNFITSVKSHVKGLSDKRYQDNKEISTLDFVIMFMPIEGTFQFLSQHAPDIFQFGWSNKVIITSPVTLFPVLQTISSIWKVEAQNRNTQEIIRTANSLYDKFMSFALSMEKIGEHIKKSEDAYVNALSQLKDGRGSAVSIVKRLEELGIEKRKKGKVPNLMQGIDSLAVKQKSASDEETLFDATNTEEAA